MTKLRRVVISSVEGAKRELRFRVTREGFDKTFVESLVKDKRYTPEHVRTAITEMIRAKEIEEVL